MPCRGPDEDYGYRRDPNPRLVKERDKLTQMLCALCRIYDHEEESWPEDLRKWWSKHQELDRRREEKKRRREEGRKKQEEAERKRRIAEARALLKKEGVGLDD